MINTNFENLKPGDLIKLAKMTAEQEVQQYFSPSVTIEPLVKDDDTIHQAKVSGTLESGMTEGGQNFSLLAELTFAEIGGGDVSSWQIKDIQVQGVNVSQEIVAPVYIPRRYIKPTDPQKLATFKNFNDEIFAFAVPAEKQIYLPKFSSMDHLAALLHENAHIKSQPFFKPDELDEADKFYRLVEKLYAQPDPLKAAQNMYQDAVTKGYLNELKRWGQSHFLLENVANQAVMDFFKITYPHIQWFKIDNDYHRLSKLLTANSLSYMHLVNNLLGRDTIAPELIQYD